MRRNEKPPLGIAGVNLNSLFALMTLASAAGLSCAAVASTSEQMAELTPIQLPPAFFQPAKIDREGLSNQVVVQFKSTGLRHSVDLDSTKGACGDIVACEVSLLAEINSGNPSAVRSALQNPLGARYLITDGRVDKQKRDALAHDDPLSQLQRSMVLRYMTVDHARHAAKVLVQHPDIELAAVDIAMTYSGGWTWTGAPNDPSLQPANAGQLGQWGMNYMNFPAAWAKTPGGSYVGVVDSGYVRGYAYQNCTVGSYSLTWFHCDLAENVRDQFFVDTGAGFPERLTHTLHVMGIIAARGDNGYGQSGGCPWCSLVVGNTGSSPLGSYGAAAVVGLVDRGVQAINVSANFFKKLPDDQLSGLNRVPWSSTRTCSTDAANFPDQSFVSMNMICNALSYAAGRDVNVVVSSGNFRWIKVAGEAQNYSPAFPATEASVISVGAISASGEIWNSNSNRSNTSTCLEWNAWCEPAPTGDTPPYAYRDPIKSSATGSVWAWPESSSAYSPGGVVAPGVSIVSTVPDGGKYSYYPHVMCGDAPGYDGTGYYYDQFGTCTGTSMAAPHVTALVGLVRSINPLLSYLQVKSIILNSGHLGGNTFQMGYGVPDALAAVNAALATNPSRLTPLFSFYSEPRSDYFYTVVPHMGSAAISGTLRPGAEWAMNSTNGGYQPIGNSVPNFSNFPGLTSASGQPLAQAWVFTTPTNPINSAQPLLPLIRLSATCADRGNVASICSSKPAHMDVTYVTDPTEIAPLLQAGYKIDGTEGFVYPTSMAQPSGAVRLLRRYNPSRDDTAIFPDVPTLVSTMTSQGYTMLSGADWIGYVYANTGIKPVVPEASVITNYIVNGSFEAPAYSTWSFPFLYGGSISGWTGTPLSQVVNNNGKTTWTSVNAPDGVQVMMLTMDDAVTTTVQLTTAGQYDLKFKAAKMNGACCGYLQSVDVKLNGATVLTATPTALTHSQYQTTLSIATPGAYTIMFSGTSVAGGAAASIDDVQLIKR